MIIRLMEQKDLQNVLQIYKEGLQTGIATFETEAPSIEVWDKGHHPTLRFVAEEQGTVIGWVTISPVSSRQVYKGVGEVSVYVSEEAKGKGVATLLMEKLILESEKAGYWTLQSSISTQNEASTSLHKKVGFRVVGVREKIGKRDGRWQDTVLMERRSKIIH